MSLLLKVACPDCSTTHEAASLGAEVRCRKCGRDFRAKADGESASQILSVTPDELDNVPYSQRSIEVPVNSVSSIIVADPTLINDKLLRDAPLKENARWVGKVRLIKKLGQGGMGAVYRGYDESLALDVAVKILPVPTNTRDDQFVQRFRQEARISAQINHPNVVRTLHVDEQGDIIYLVMDFIEGQTARNLVDGRGPLAIPLALQIMQDAARGVQAAHSHSVIHRDIKPDNILVADNGRVLITDLGLAKARVSGGGAMPVTRMGLLLGTPEYMSPEQWEIGAEIGPAADIWSLGATLWLLLTHQPPFVEKDLGLLARKIKELPLPDIRLLRPNVPDRVLEILERCLAKKPQDRYPDCAALMDAIAVALNDISAGKATVTVRPQETVRSVHAQPAVSLIPAPPPIRASIPAPQPVKPALAEPRPVIIHEQSPKSRLWIAAAVVIAAAAVVLSVMPRTQPAPAVVPVIPAAPVVTMNLVYPAEVKPGQDTLLRAVISGADPAEYTTTWTEGDKVLEGAQIKVALQNDTRYVVILRENKTKREIERKEIKIAVELQARASEKDFLEIETGSELTLTGSVSGGEQPDKVDTRWVDLSKPQQPLVEGLTFQIAEDSPYSLPGRHTFVFQAKRKEQLDWSSAASHRVVLQVDRKVTPEFKAAMKEGMQAREKALQAKTGALASAYWKDALACFERANQIFADDEAAAKFEQSRQRLEMEDKYANLIEEAKRLKQAAEAIPESDGVRRLAAWSEALRPWTAALVLFDRPEAREQSAVVEAKLREQRTLLESAETDRAKYETMVAKARSSTREAKKYLSPKVALPHWEAALEGFTELSRLFPRRVDEFSLELKEAQENRDKAYLEDVFGVVPVKAGEKPQDLNPSRPKDPVETQKTPAPAPAPAPRLPEPRAAPR